MVDTYKSYRFRIYPNEKQKNLLEKHFGCTRFVYNYFLNERNVQHKQGQKSDRYYTQCKKLTLLKKEPDYTWLNEVGGWALQYSLKSLDKSFKSFFLGASRYPKFKSKSQKNSFTVGMNIKVKESRVCLPKFQEGIKSVFHRDVYGNIKQATVKKTSSGKYYVSILCKVKCSEVAKTGRYCGVDLGLCDIISTSDGEKIPRKNYTKQIEKELARAQKHLARKRSGSKSHNRQRVKVAKIYEKAAQKRVDELHKISHGLVRNYDLICLEDLNIKGMLKNRKVSKSISDASWSTLVKFIEYKAKQSGKEVIKIDKFFPSTKLCNICGSKAKNLKMSDRVWTCKNGHELDRDINASINILKEGLRIKSDGTFDYTGGDLSKSSFREHESVKPEASLLNNKKAVHLW